MLKLHSMYINDYIYKKGVLIIEAKPMAEPWIPRAGRTRCLAGIFLLCKRKHPGEKEDVWIVIVKDDVNFGFDV